MKQGLRTAIGIVMAAATMASLPAKAAQLVIIQSDIGNSYGGALPDDASLLIITGSGSSIPVFDSTLGMLNSVALEINDSYEIAIGITRPPKLGALAKLTLPFSFSSMFSGPVAGGQSTSKTFFFDEGTTSDTLTFNTGGGLYGDFTAAGYQALAGTLLIDDLELSLSNADASQLGFRAAGSISRTVSKTFTFDYTPFAAMVPEPSSWALMIAGVGLTGAALRRRRMPTAIASAKPA